eukprot:TRINITY_DN539_c0_g1_i2.p1 TRINITY_DN539_c0_g1~~TRINITY_DN539_c0_g1_i2.p1  ORF type:complete len:764 (-),score=94.43 TRINITY_DN539_c0_g1_i2:3890-6181(-)
MDANLINSVRPPKIDPVQCLGLLESAFCRIFSLDSKALSYEELYRTSYHLTAYQYGGKLYESIKLWITENIKNATKQIRAVDEPAAFLHNIQQVWFTVHTALGIINGIFIYLDEKFIRPNKLQGITLIGYKYFIDVALKNTGNIERLKEAVLLEIAKDRNGELVDKSAIKGISSMFIKISQCTGERLYEDSIEVPYIVNVMEHYSVEAQKFLSEMPVPNYLLSAEQSMEKEMARCRNFLERETEAKLKGILNDTFICNNLHKIFTPEVNWLEALIQQYRAEDLKRAYRIFSEKDNKRALDRFILILKEIILMEGKKYIQEASMEQNSVKLIEKILAMQEKYKVIWSEHFMKDKEIFMCILTAFQKFINLKETIPHALAYYCHALLSKKISHMSEVELEKQIEQIMTLFKYIQYKDTFAQYYVRLLANRLLFRTTANDDAERSIITKLKAECGAQYTQKMETMMKDIAASREECDKFMDSVEGGHLRSKFDVRVLTQGIWPFETHSIPCKLPSQLNSMHELFSNYYMAKHKGRQLNWKANKGELELSGFFPATKKRYEFVASAYQGTVILLFNEYESLSVKEIASKTMLPSEEVARIGKVLVGIKLLEEEEQGLRVNPKFISTRLKIRIPAGKDPRASNPGKSGEVEKEVLQERNIKIDATIVKIMKARHKEEHNILINDTIKLLSQNFLADPSFVKLRIEHLIETEYIERSEKGRNIYVYKAQSKTISLNSAAIFMIPLCTYNPIQIKIIISSKTNRLNEGRV